MALRLPPFRNPFAERENYTDAARLVGDFVDPRQSISDAYWAITHPRDRIMGRGRAANQQMAFPLGGRWAPKTPGLRAEGLQQGDEWVDYTGDREVFKSFDEFSEAPAEWSTSVRRGYNLRNEKNKIVASADRLRGTNKDAIVPSIWVDPEYRKTGAFNDLINLISHGGKLDVRGAYANPRLEALMTRRSDPERLKALKAVAKIPDRRVASATRRGLAEPTQWRGAPSQLDKDISELRRQAEVGRGFQVTNQDIGHPLAPVRRPPPPRPSRPARLTPTQQQLRLSNELRQRRRGGV